MRLLALTALLLLAHAAEPPAAPSWPMWDGAESVEQYARRAKVEPTKTLDLGNGIKLEMVLIPAGKFVMGTEEPEPVDEVISITGRSYRLKNKVEKVEMSEEPDRPS